MEGCEVAVTITAAACAMAQDKTAQEIAMLGVIFTQLGDTLATLALYKEN
ncbi:MAG: hypothetical protein J6M02_03615 [Clostridia bacterium]|nr:hypothetical protein [Clostridia bacterium]